jgi:hypothetical protein
MKAFSFSVSHFAVGGTMYGQSLHHVWCWGHLTIWQQKPERYPKEYCE